MYFSIQEVEHISLRSLSTRLSLSIVKTQLLKAGLTSSVRGTCSTHAVHQVHLLKHVDHIVHGAGLNNIAHTLPLAVLAGDGEIIFSGSSGCPSIAICYELDIKILPHQLIGGPHLLSDELP